MTDPLVQGGGLSAGHDKNPLTDAQLALKFRGLAEPALGPERGGGSGIDRSPWKTDPRPHEAIAPRRLGLSDPA